MPIATPAGTAFPTASLAIFADGSANEGQSGTTHVTFTVRRAGLADNGSSFPLGDGSVRVVNDGTSNTVLFGEGNAAFSGNATDGYTARFGDGSVRFVRDAAAGWQYLRRNGTGEVVAEGGVVSDARFTFGDGSVRFIADGLSNTLLFGEQAATLRGSDAAGWQVAFGDGSVRNLGSTSRFLSGDGSVRFIGTGASFLLGDGSVRVVNDGTSNTVLLGEGNATFTGSEAQGYAAGFADGSVRFVRDTIAGWQYQRRNPAGETVAAGAVANGTTFTFGDGSVRFLADGLSNTILFGTTDVSLHQAPGGSWSAVLGDGSVRQLGDGQRIQFEPGILPFAGQAASVSWAVGGTGAAPAGAADFTGATLPAGILSFAPGQTSATISVPVAGDTTPEPDEGFTVTLSGASPGADIAGATASTAILNDDGPAAVLSIAPQQAVQAEGPSGTTLFTFTVRRAGLADNGASFPLGDGSVRVVSDGISNTVLFARGNAVFTGNETDGVSASFSDGSVRFVRDAVEGWRYLRRNGAGEVVAEGDVASDTTFTFGDGSVRFLADGLSNTVLFGEQVAALQGSEAGWQATFGDGSVRNLGSTSRYLPGDGSVRFIGTGASFRLGDGSVRVVNDGLSNTVLFGEGNAVFSGNETDGVSAAFSDGSVRFVRDAVEGWQYSRRTGAGEVVGEGDVANGTTFTFGDGSVRFLADGLSNTLLFGDSGATLQRAPGGSWSAQLSDGSVRQLGDGQRIVFEAGVLPFAAQGALVNWAVSGTGAAPAGAADFAGAILPAGTVSFAPGQTSATISVPVAGDTTPEPDEGFTVTLSAASPGTRIAGPAASATILNDDGPPAVLSLARQQAARAEGQSGATSFTFLATRTGDTTRPASALWSVAGGGVANTVAANGADFVGGMLPSGTVSFAPGQASRTIAVEVRGDTAVELNESFLVTLHSPSPGAVLGTATASAIVYNDDTPGTGTLSIARAGAQKPEGTGGGTTQFTFTVTRGGDSSGTAAVDWAVSGGGVANTVAAGAADFAGGTLPSGRLQFAAGQGTATIAVNVAADAAIELNEGFTVTLSAPQAGVALATATATGAILNDDAPPSGELSIAPLAASRGEGDAGGTSFTFVVTRTQGTQGPASATWSVAGGGIAGTASATGEDFGGALPAGTVSFAPGQTSQVVTVPVAGDTAAEQDESFTVTLANPQARVAIATASATGVILNDDFASTAASQTLAGTDLFRLQPAAVGPAAGNATTLEDFSRAAGEVIDLSAIDAIAVTLANDPFTFIGTTPFGGVAGQLRWQDEGALKRVQGDVNGDAVADVTLLVRTTTSASSPCRPQDLQEINALDAGKICSIKRHPCPWTPPGT